jgi:hypothetical protein
MIRIISTIVVIISLLNISNAQKNDDLQKKVKQLESRIAFLESRFNAHTRVYDHNEFDMSVLRSRLALGLNRNFTYSGSFYETEADTMDGKGYQRIIHFEGHRSVADQNQSLSSDQSSYLKIVRQNLNAIKNIVIGEQTEPTKISEDYTVYPYRLIINYYDNVAGGEPIITADTKSNSLKVRINGVLQEIGWE